MSATDDRPWRMLLGDFPHCLPECFRPDHVITDPPYSKRTHAGHNAGRSGDKSNRAALEYAGLTETEAEEYAIHLGAMVRGWMVVMTDHLLAPVWERGMRLADLYTFAPVPYVAPGSRVRLQGDGPSTWTVWLVVGRTKAAAKWRTLPGAYIRGAGWDRPVYTGGKPIALMEAIVRDYSNPGDTILDPFAGAGTTGVASIRLGRRFLGCERNEAAHRLAVERLTAAREQRELFDDLAVGKGEQVSLGLE